MINVLFVGLGGFIGASLRYLAGNIFSFSSDFPFVTLMINLVGSFLIGFISSVAGNSGYISKDLQLFLQTGICGGFTTFSTFSLETVNLIECGRVVFAGLYVLFSVILCIVGVLAGKYVAGLIVN